MPYQIVIKDPFTSVSYELKDFQFKIEAEKEADIITEKMASNMCEIVLQCEKVIKGFQRSTLSIDKINVINYFLSYYRNNTCITEYTENAEDGNEKAALTI